MAWGLNKVLLIGNLGKDPEMKYTPQGTPITTFSVAVTRRRKGADSEWKDETEWFRIVAWEKLAETCNEYLRKGSKVYLEGRLQTREFQGQDGQPRQSIEVVANEMIILDSRQGGPGGPGAGYGASDEQRPSTRSAAAPSNAGSSSFNNNYEDDTDADDIPF